MSRYLLCCSVLLAIILVDSAYCFDLYDSNYTSEVYVKYESGKGGIRGMVFDSAGNLYVAQRGLKTDEADGVIYKVDTNGDVSEFATGFFCTAQIVWAGGTEYGEYLYVTDAYQYVDTYYEADSEEGEEETNIEKHKRVCGGVMKIDLEGNKTVLTGDITQPFSIAIDETGLYGGHMYIGNVAADHLWKVDLSGDASVYKGFPNNASGGGPYGIAFDTTGKYGGMFVCCYSNQPQYNGIFKIDTEGNISLFVSTPENSRFVAFGSDMFDHDMYVAGSNAGGRLSLWRLSTDGEASLFACHQRRPLETLVFGPGGSMYTAFWDGGETTTIVRIYKTANYLR
jgi:sugar lactone lactonase YvrE